MSDHHPTAAIPLTVITGIDAAAKTRVALALLRSGGTGWSVLDNDGGASAAAAGALNLPSAQSSGCACCTGQVLIHAALVQLLRQHRPQQLLLVAAAAAEPRALRRALAQGSAMQAWQVVQRICVFDAALFTTVADESRALWQAQRDAADVVIHCDAVADTAAIEAQLDAAMSLSAMSLSKASSRRITS